MPDMVLLGDVSTQTEPVFWQVAAKVSMDGSSPGKHHMRQVMVLLI
jgi:hypothetical protein